MSQAPWSRVPKFQKTHILRKKVLKSPRFLEDLGGFLAFFF
jgi:hypothetical protein